jgi:hypothetical protein
MAYLQADNGCLQGTANGPSIANCMGTFMKLRCFSPMARTKDKVPLSAGTFPVRCYDKKSLPPVLARFATGSRRTLTVT